MTQVERVRLLTEIRDLLREIRENTRPLQAIVKPPFIQIADEGDAPRITDDIVKKGVKGALRQ